MRVSNTIPFDYPEADSNPIQLESKVALPAAVVIHLLDPVPVAAERVSSLMARLIPLRVS